MPIGEAALPLSAYTRPPATTAAKAAEMPTEPAAAPSGEKASKPIVSNTAVLASALKAPTARICPRRL